MGYSKNAYGVAGDDLGSSERTGAGAQRRRIGGFATGHNSLISPSRFLVLAMATSAVGQTVEAPVVAVLASFGAPASACC